MTDETQTEQETPATFTDLTTPATGLISPSKPPIIASLVAEPAPAPATEKDDLILGRYKVCIKAVDGEGALVWIEDTQAENAKLLPAEVSPTLAPFDVYFGEDKMAKNLHQTLIDSIEHGIEALTV